MLFYPGGVFVTLIGKVEKCKYKKQQFLIGQKMTDHVKK